MIMDGLIFSVHEEAISSVENENRRCRRSEKVQNSYPGNTLGYKVAFQKIQGMDNFKRINFQLLNFQIFNFQMFFS